jgi:hypothetical protein
MITIYQVINNLEKEIITIKDKSINKDIVKSIIKILYDKINKRNCKYYFVDEDYR